MGRERPLGVEGIDPAKAGEAGEVGVTGIQLGAVLDGQGREVRVVDEILGIRRY